MYQEFTKKMKQFLNTNKAHLDELAFLFKNNAVFKVSVCAFKKGDAFFWAQIVENNDRLRKFNHLNLSKLCTFM